MAFRIVLILAILAQITAAGLALRLNKRYRWYSAWVLISGAAAMLSILELAVLAIVWWTDFTVAESFPFWTACLSALLVSVLFVGGVGLIEPLFIEISQAEKLLQAEKLRLENVVQENEDELRLARQIQQRLLPDSSPDLPGFDIAGASQPAVWTSGDYFDFIPLSDGTLGVIIADVSGHGTGPALLMTATRAYLRALAHSHNDPGTMLTIANRAIADDVDHGRFVTVFLGRLSAAARSLTFTSAGHDGVLLARSGETTPLDFGGPPLGAIADSVFHDAPPIKLNDGDILILVSDGIPEMESPDREQFGVDRMVKAVHENRHKTARDIVDLLLKAASKFSGTNPQRDDMTAVIVKVGKA